MKVFIFITLLLLYGSAFSQTSRIRLDTDLQYGWVIAHNEELADIANVNPIGVGLKYQWMKNSRKNWEACNCFHYLGVGVIFHDFRNPDELGQAISLYGNFEPVLYRGNRVELSLGMGVGATYITKVYDAETNPRNTFFSAPLSFLLFVKPAVTYSLHDDWAVSATFTYNHISNGGQKKPNRGMNYPMVGLGLNYFVKNEPLPTYERNNFDGSWEYYIDGGVNVRDTPDGGRDPNFNLNIGTYRRVLPIIGLGGGVEMSYDLSLMDDDGGQGVFLPALFVANHFLFGRFDFSQHFAMYLTKPEGYMADKTFYQRYTLHYTLTEKIRLGAGLKAHGHVAELLDIRFGVLLK